MEINIETISKVAAIMISTTSSLILAWKGRSKWEPTEQDLPQGAQRTVSLLISVALAVIYIFFFKIEYFDLLLKITIVLLAATAGSFIIYSLLIGIYTYSDKTNTKTIGGFCLTKKAKALRLKEELTVGQTYEKLNYSTDDTWTRPSRSLTKACFMICYLIFVFSGSIALSTISTVVIIKSNDVTIPSPVERSIIKVGFVLNGDVSYTRDAMEGFKEKLNKLLENSKFSPYYESVIGYGESSNETGNVHAIESLISKFSGHPDYMITIGTEVTKVAKKHYLNRFPIIFTAVSYPITDSIVNTLNADPERGNLAGVAYGDPAKNMLLFLKTSFPEKRYGFIYNPAYAQDLSMYRNVINVQRELNVEVSLISTDTTKLTTDQLSKADIFFGRYFLLKNLGDFITLNNKPFIGNDLLFVKKGALGCIETSGKLLGSLAAEKVLFRNLQGNIALSDIPIHTQSVNSTSFNLRSARHYNITISQNSLRQATLVLPQ